MKILKFMWTVNIFFKANNSIDILDGDVSKKGT